MKGLIAFVLCATGVYGATVPISSINKPVQKSVHDVSVPVTVEPVENFNHHEHEQVQKPVAILSQNVQVNPDGSYVNVFESENGIKLTEEGSTKIIHETVVNSISGVISYKDADGNLITLTYVADEKGFQPTGDHLPTPPPVPLSVVRALEYIAAHPYIEKYKNNVESVKTEEAPIVDDA